MTHCKYCGADLPPNKQIRVNKQIKIEQLIPFMNEGWVAMDEDGGWSWFSEEPQINDILWTAEEEVALVEIFDIAPAEDWTKSLIKIERK